MEETPRNVQESSLVLEALSEIAQSFADNLKLAPVLQSCLACAMRLVGCHSGSIMLLSPDSTELEVVAAEGPRASQILGQRQTPSASISGAVLQGNEPLLLKGRATGRDGPASEFPQDLNWSVVAPMHMGRRPLGVININCDGDTQVEPAVMHLVQLLANQAALLIENARLYEELADKEKRLELFVDRLIRTQEEIREAAADPPASLAGVMSRTVSEFSKAAVPPSNRSLERGFAERLTSRETQVLSLIVEGMTNKEIAAALTISADTVKTHVQEIIGKLGVADRTQAAVMAIRSGLMK